MNYKKAALVQHVAYGEGKVLESRNGGLEYLVEFHNLRPKWIRRERLRFLEPTRENLGEFDNPTASLEVHSGQFDSRRMIEALRLGIVPLESITEFTFGRDREIAVLDAWLQHPTDNVMTLVGEYGAGKTHFLQFMRSYALRKGFAVAEVSIDPVASPFYKPKSIWSELARSFTYPAEAGEAPQSGTGLGDLRSFLSIALKRHDFEDHPFLEEVRSHPDNEVVWEWIYGNACVARPWTSVVHSDGYERRYELPALYNYATAINQYTYLLSTISWAARTLLGLRGLLLIFDEAEALGEEAYKSQLERSVNTLRALIHMALDDTKLGDTVEASERCGLPMRLVGTVVPFVYRFPTYIKMVLASTSKVLKPCQGIRDLHLSPIPREALEKVHSRIEEKYTQAYSTAVRITDPSALIDRLDGGSSPTRMYVKACVELLDLHRLVEGISEASLLS